MIVSRIQSVFYIIVATKLVVVNGKTIHTVTVGAAGRTIEPPFLVVEMDDIVTFVLSGYFHTVTQSTFENPLVPLSGGFNSGMAIRDIDGSISVRTWDLRITDNLHPIWFFCKGSQQPSNCTEGIVGSINPPNQTIYNVFASAGNQNSCSLTPTPTASSPSIVIPTSIHEVSSVIPSSTRVSFADDAPTGTPPTMAVPDSGHRRRGAIIGGVIGGVLGLILLLLAVYLCWWRRRRSRSGADRDGANPFQTHESKIESTMLNLRPEVTTLPPSASSDKHAPSQLNADRPKIGILDSPSFSPLGVQQPQSQPGPQQRHDPTNVVYATYPKAKVGQQADAASSPFTISSSAPDKSGPALREVDPLQQSESPPIPAVFTSAPESEKQGPTFIEGSTEAEQEELPPSTYRTPMGARLRQVRRAEEAHPEYGTVIGIDLGTSYSRVGVQRGGTFQIIPNEQGQRATRSSVCFTGKKRLVGDFSNDFNPNNTVFAIKRLIGRKMDDLDVIRDMKQFPFKVTGKNGAPTVTVKINGRERSFTPEEITATVITRMKETAEAHLGHKVTHAVVTVPACFNDAQRQATKDAGKIAGLDIIRILNEPTAAAIAYGLDKKGVSRVLVYDLGGGFFDVSLLSIDDGVFEVLATAGDTRLGGEDFDNRVMEHFIQLYKTKTGTDVSQNIFALAKLKSKVERAKRILSSEQSARVEIRSFENGNDFSQTLTRATFEELNIDLFNKTIRLVEKVLKDANYKKGEVDEVLLIGGSSHIPRVQQLLNGIFSGKERSNEADSDDSIVHGAAIQGGILSGTETAADIILVDVCPRSLGIETIGEVFSILIPRNSEIPTKKSGIYTTAFDNQRVVSIKVFEGEHVQTKYNNLLGRFELTGIPPAPSGVPQIKVTFAIDADGIMQVRASDLGTGNTNSIRIVTNKGRLTKVEIMRMLTETAAEG